MAMLKTLARKFGGCKQIKDYLARNGRAITFRSSSIDLDRSDWDEQMNATRQMFGKDTGRKYYHFVISPDPEDGLDAKAVDTLAYDWVRERYSGYQWAIETHIDNGIPHAHIVVNSVNPVDGRSASAAITVIPLSTTSSSRGMRTVPGTRARRAPTAAARSSCRRRARRADM